MRSATARNVSLSAFACYRTALHLGVEAEHGSASSFSHLADHQREDWRKHKPDCAGLTWWDDPQGTFPESEKVVKDEVVEGEEETGIIYDLD